ncbi:MAG TPA: hypothetical protein VGJ45_21430 [Pseudonocardiaceae bacterium]
MRKLVFTGGSCTTMLSMVLGAEMYLPMSNWMSGNASGAATAGLTGRNDALPTRSRVASAVASAEVRNSVLREMP